MNIIHKIKYPIIAFSNGAVIYLARHEADLTICSKRGFDNGFYNDLKIIDSDGNSFDVHGANKVGYGGFLWGFSLKYGQRVRIELILSDSYKDISIEDFKEKVLKQIKKDKHFWNAGGNFENLVLTIKDGKSYNEIINFLTNYFYNESSS